MIEATCHCRAVTLEVELADGSDAAIVRSAAGAPPLP